MKNTQVEITGKQISVFQEEWLISIMVPLPWSGTCGCCCHSACLPSCRSSSTACLNRQLSGVTQRGLYPEDQLKRCLLLSFHSGILRSWDSSFLFFLCWSSFIPFLGLSPKPPQSLPEPPQLTMMQAPCKIYLFSYKPQRPVNSVGQGTGYKYFRLCEPNGFCCNPFNSDFVAGKQSQIILKQGGCFSKKKKSQVGAEFVSCAVVCECFIQTIYFVKNNALFRVIFSYKTMYYALTV